MIMSDSLPEVSECEIGLPQVGEVRMYSTITLNVPTTGRHGGWRSATWVLLTSLLIVSCGEELPSDPDPTDAEVATITLMGSADTLIGLGLTLQLSALATDDQGNTLLGESFTWTSGNPDVASITGEGLVTAVANGTARITAAASGIEGSGIITVAHAPDIKWRLTTGTSHRSGAAIGSDGTLYMCGSDGSLYAINPGGSGKWTYETGDPFHSSPALGTDGTVYVVTELGELHAVNPDGTAKWVFPAEGRLTSPALGENGTIYFGTEDVSGGVGKLYAVTSDGSQQWVFDPTGLGPIQTPPTVATDGTIYFRAGGEGDLRFYHALNPDGTTKWEEQEASILLAIGADGTLYFAHNDRDFSIPHGTWGTYVSARSPDDGTLMWTSDQFPSGIVNSTPAIAGDGTIYIASCGQWLNAYNPDGTQKWRASIADDGEHEWPPNRDCEPSNITLSADGSIFLAAASTVNDPRLIPGSGLWRNRFFAFNADGSMKWTLSINRPSSAAIGSDGTVYVGSTDGVYAIAGGGGALADSPWPIFKRDQRNSGYAGSQ